MTAAAHQSSRTPKGTPDKCFGDFLSSPGVFQKANPVTETPTKLY
ncbi:hypothetical protein BH11CYA1_BH11CYA1_15070 [soil metagenome]